MFDVVFVVLAGSVSFTTTGGAGVLIDLEELPDPEEEDDEDDDDPLPALLSLLSVTGDGGTVSDTDTTCRVPVVLYELLFWSFISRAMS